MSLSNTITGLKSVAADAKSLFDVLKGLAEQDKDARQSDKKELRALADKLDENARKAARERRDEEIKALDAVIADHDVVLQVSGLSKAARDAVKADRMAAVARRGRLNAQAGTDFGGILTKTVTEELAAVLKKARQEVKKKKKAAAFLQSAVKVADLALRIAGKLAM